MIKCKQAPRWAPGQAPRWAPRPAPGRAPRQAPGQAPGLRLIDGCHH